MRQHLFIFAPAYESPFPFVGGVIEQGVVDVSGEPFLDVEIKAERMSKRS